VTELRLHRTLYLGTAVDEAIKVYGAYATFEQQEQDDHWVVRVSSTSPARERRVARELANYALGLTVAAHGQPRRAP
jgi:hypothetical protein